MHRSEGRGGASGVSQFWIKNMLLQLYPFAFFHVASRLLGSPLAWENNTWSNHTLRPPPPMNMQVYFVQNTDQGEELGGGRDCQLECERKERKINKWVKGPLHTLDLQGVHPEVWMQKKCVCKCSSDRCTCQRAAIGCTALMSVLKMWIPRMLLHNVRKQKFNLYRIVLFECLRRLKILTQSGSLWFENI